MVHVCRGVIFAVLGGLALILSSQPASAQAAGGDPVHITTVDGVELHGMFYPATKKDAPTIIFLHKLGESGMKKANMKMAEALQANYSVLLFDFRGHGKSKDIAATDFWKLQPNRDGIKGASPKKTSIEFGEMKKEYFPVLCNDISAVKAWLDRKNDARDCNTSSTILIGAESGATLGAIWLNSQWHLTRMIPNPNNPMLPAQPSINPEGKDIIACIWLSIDPKLAGTAMSLTKTLGVPVGGNGCPTLFMYGKENSKDRDLNEAVIKGLKGKNSDDRHKFVMPYPLPGTSARGMSLAVVGVEKRFQEYLEVVVEKKGGEWGKRDFKTSQYMWRMNNQLIPAKMIPSMDPNNLMYDTYEKFIAR